MKVYVVTDGEYSDYHIVAIFTDKKAANEYNKEMLLNENSVLTMETDVVEKSPVGLYPYEVYMEYDGAVKILRRMSIDNFKPGETLLNFKNGEKIENYLSARVYAKNEEHAVKIVNEKRTQMIARNEWLLR